MWELQTLASKPTFLPYRLIKEKKTKSVLEHLGFSQVSAISSLYTFFSSNFTLSHCDYYY